MPLLKPPLSVRGVAITDSGGHPVKLAGVNWAGAHQDGLVPSMPDRLHRDVIARRIAAAGFNDVRLPFALGTIVNRDGSPRTGPASGGHFPTTSGGHVPIEQAAPNAFDGRLSAGCK
jgi:hypothetical protein